MDAEFEAILQSVNLVELIQDLTPTRETPRLSSQRGGRICDPRPGHEETRPSFSVTERRGIWLFNRFGGDGGNAFGYLTSIGYSRKAATEELKRRAGINTSHQRSRSKHLKSAPPAPSALERAGIHLGRCRPFDERDRARYALMVGPLETGSSAAQELERRGMHDPVRFFGDQPPGRTKWAHRTRDGLLISAAGALVIPIRGPDGRVWAAKARNPDEAVRDGASRYAYLIGGHGAPAWCSADYGGASVLLVCEGELNAVAAARAALVCGLTLDVQGVAGSESWPFLEGLDRPCLIYTDGDEAGDRAAGRWIELAVQCGSPSVARMAPREHDFCEVLAASGSSVLGGVLEAAMEAV